MVHLDVSEPYCPVLRKLLQEKAPAHGLSFAGEAVYCCTEGPRFETAAEIRMYRQLGAHVVGMTGVPEVVLAREMGICYAGGHYFQFLHRYVQRDDHGGNSGGGGKEQAQVDKTLSGHYHPQPFIAGAVPLQPVSADPMNRSSQEIGGKSRFFSC